MCQQPTTNTCFRFAERNEKKFVDVVKKETQSIGKIKVEFAISVIMWEKNVNGEKILVHHYYKGEPRRGLLHTLNYNQYY